MNRLSKLYGHTIELTVTYARLIEQNVMLLPNKSPGVRNVVKTLDVVVMLARKRTKSGEYERNPLKKGRTKENYVDSAKPDLVTF